jgi:hypothetical protein
VFDLLKLLIPTPTKRFLALKYRYQCEVAATILPKMMNGSGVEIIRIIEKYNPECEFVKGK